MATSLSSWEGICRSYARGDQTVATSHQKTGRIVTRAVVAALAISLFDACTSDKKEGADAGARTDAGRQDSGVSDAGANDSSTPKDAAGEQLDATATTDGAVDGGKLDGSAGAPDAAVVDPITAGSDKPTLTKVGYFNDDPLGPRVLILGRDPNGDIASYTIKFFHDATPVGFDIDNTADTPDVTEFGNTITPVPNEAGFFITVAQTEEFVALVNNVKIIVTDAGGRKSDELSATLGAAPTVTSSCSPYGFDRCSGTNVCGKTGTVFSCRSAVSARTSACSGTVLTLAPPAVTSVSGRVEPPSLWDAPMGCSPSNVLKPDRVVKLKLAAAAAKVVLTTNNPNTNFDTVLYKLETCQAQPASCVDADCPCADDIVMDPAPRINKSRLELTNLAKGDHYFVVDSLPTNTLTGDWFELTVTVE